MERRKQEMSQIYHSSKNEFIFGEKGGKGKHLSSFLKNLSLTSAASSNSKKTDNYRNANSNIYGEMSYGHQEDKDSTNPRDKDRTGYRSSSVGASFTHLNSPSTEHFHEPNSYSFGINSNSSPLSIKRSSTSNRYTDLDDDWDAGLDEVDGKDKRSDLTSNILNNVNNNSTSSINLNSGEMLDSLYPDLTFSMSSFNNKALGEKLTKSESQVFDNEDLQTKAEISKLNQLNSKYFKFRRLLTEDSNIQIQELRKLSWNGIPPELRALTWQLLIGYLPANKSRQSSTVKRKREEYLEGLKVISVDLEDDKPDNSSTASITSNANTNKEKQLAHQIIIDVKRTNPYMKLYGRPEVQLSLRKVLFLWAVRHPASGYVQGINDLCTPFYQIFLLNYIWQLQKKKDEHDLFIPGLLDDNDEKERALLSDPNLMNYNLENFDPSKLSARVHGIIEADTYWCLSRLLETITDNYIHGQPGILRQVNELQNLISKIDIELINHFDNEKVEFIQFSFRWMNCLLMREMSINLIIRMWDTYLSETPIGFNNFHVYVCAAFLIKFSPELKQRDFQEILLFLQNPPTSTWKEKDVELILSEAFIWQSLYKNAAAHLR